MGRSRLDYRKKHKGTLSEHSRKEISEYHKKEKANQGGSDSEEKFSPIVEDDSTVSDSFEIRDEEFAFSQLIEFKDELLPIETYNYKKYQQEGEVLNEFPMKHLTSTDIEVIGKAMNRISLSDQISEESNIKSELNKNYAQISDGDVEGESNERTNQIVSEPAINSVKNTLQDLRKENVTKEDDHSKKPLMPVPPTIPVNGIGNNSGSSQNVNQEKQEDLEAWLDSIL